MQPQPLTYPLGTCIDVKSFETGVVVDYRDDIEAYVGRFGGLRGEAGSELRKIDEAEIIGPVTAAVGLPVLTPGGNGRVLARNPDGSYGVNLEGAVAGRTVANYAPHELSCRIAKVMPLVERVAERGRKMRREVQEGADVSTQVEDVLLRLERLEEWMESATEEAAEAAERAGTKPSWIPEIEKGASELKMERGDLERTVSERQAAVEDAYGTLRVYLETAADRLRKTVGGGGENQGREERRRALQLVEHLLSVEEYERPRREKEGEREGEGGGEQTEKIRREVMRTELQMQLPLRNRVGRLRELADAVNDPAAKEALERAAQTGDELLDAQIALGRSMTACTMWQWRDDLYDSLEEILKEADQQAKEEGGSLGAKAVAAVKIVQEKVGGAEGVTEKAQQMAAKVQEQLETAAPEAVTEARAIGEQAADVAGKLADQAGDQARDVAGKVSDITKERHPEAHAAAAGAVEEARSKSEEAKEQVEDRTEEAKKRAEEQKERAKEAAEKQAPSEQETKEMLDRAAKQAQSAADEAKKRAEEVIGEHKEEVDKATALLQKARERVAARAAREDWRGTARQKALKVEEEVRELLPSVLRQVATSERRARDVLRMLKGEDIGELTSNKAEALLLRYLEDWVLAWLSSAPPGEGEDKTLPKGLKAVAEGHTAAEEGVPAGLAGPAGGGRRRATLYDMYSAGDLINMFETGELADELARSLLRTALQRTYEMLAVAAGREPGDVDIGGRGYRPAAAAALTLRELLAGVTGGGMSMEQAFEKAQAFLSTEDGVQLASDIIAGTKEHATAMVEQVQEMAEQAQHMAAQAAGRAEETAGGAQEALADARIRERLRQQYEELDTELMWRLTQASLQEDDPEARRRLVALLVDEAGKFIRDTLPHIKLPPVSGKTKNNISYTISNLSMSRFNLSEAGVKMEIADVLRLADAVTRDEEVKLAGTAGISPPSTTVTREVAPVAEGVGAEEPTRLRAEVVPLRSQQGRAYPESSPDTSEGEEEAEEDVGEGEITEQGLRLPGGTEPMAEGTVESELFRVSANVRAELSDVAWSFRKETFPWTFGDGAASGRLRAAVRIGFALKAGTLHREAEVETPLLVVTQRDVIVDRVKLHATDSALAPALNAFARVARESIRHQVAEAVRHQIDGNASAFLRRLNRLGAQTWPLLATGTSIDLARLPKATERELRIARGDLAPGMIPREGEVVVEKLGKFNPGALSAQEVTVSFPEEGPIGVDVAEVEGQYQDRTVVVALEPGMQAERILSGSGPVLLGAEIVAVADEDTRGKKAEELRALLQRARPIKVTFRTYVPRKSLRVGEVPAGLRVVRTVSQDLGVKFRASHTLGQLVTEVSGYTEPRTGQPSRAVLETEMPVGTLLFSINGERLLGVDFPQVAKLLQDLGRPVEFGLLASPDRDLRVGAPPSDIRFVERNGRYVVGALKLVPSPHEGNSSVHLGDVLCSINGHELLGPEAKGVANTLVPLEDPAMYPVTLRLVHVTEPSEMPAPGQPEGFMEKMKHRMKSYELKAHSREELGLYFEPDTEGRAVLKALAPIAGPTWRGTFLRPGMQLIAVNKEPVTAEMLVMPVKYPATFTFRDLDRFKPIEEAIMEGRRKLGPLAPDVNPVEAIGEAVLEKVHELKEQLPQAIHETKAVATEKAAAVTGKPAASMSEQPGRRQELVG